MEEPIRHFARKMLREAAWDHHDARLLLSGEGTLSPGAVAGYIIVSIFLVIFSGTMAGLTLGLLSIDK